MKSRKTQLKPDKNGNYCREIGYLDLKTRKQPRFNLGKDQLDAEKRIERIMALLKDCAELNDGVQIWDEFSLNAAQQLANGATEITYTPDWEQLSDCTCEFLALAIYVRQYRHFQKRYPSITIIPAEDEMYEKGALVTKKFQEHLLDQLETKLSNGHFLGERDRLPEKLISGTLNEALDRHIEKIKVKSVKSNRPMSAWEQVRTESVKRIQERQPDLPLRSLDYDTVKDWIAYLEKSNIIRNRIRLRRIRIDTSKLLRQRF